MTASSGARTAVTVWIAADQLSVTHSALVDRDPASCTVLIIESIARGRQLPYHKRKLVLVYSGMRHFADDLRARGFHVDYYLEAHDFESAFAAHVAKYRPATVVMMEQLDYGVTDRFRAVVEASGCAFGVTPACNFIATREEFSAAFGTSERMTMERFYRKMREKTGLLMESNAPVRGRWNFDQENRKAPARGLTAPPRLCFPADAHTREVIAMVERHFPDHPGEIGAFDLPVCRADALAALEDFVEHRLDRFGPYEDAMVTGQTVLFHSMLSSSINLGLLHPLECARRAERAYYEGAARIESVEGYIRQIIGWREFVRGIYERFMPEYRTRNALAADLPLPQFYWSGETRMACVKDAVDTVRTVGWSHHIPRLMVLANFGLIAGIAPVALNDWFWAMFIDGYDWVMVPNVIGMALHADGGIVGTKPYASSARYINAMSTHCKGCYYDPRSATGERACPFNSLYWDFLARHRERFAHNARMALIMRGLAARPDAWLAELRAHAASLRARLRRGDSI